MPGDQDLINWSNIPLQNFDKKKLVIRVVDEKEGRQLNRQFRDKDAATNVLSFPAATPLLSEQAAYQANYLGDIVLCAPVIKREASEQGKTHDAHWAHMLIHGILHLQGYDHLTEAEAADMESREVELLAELGYPDPYLTTSHETA